MSDQVSVRIGHFDKVSDQVRGTAVAFAWLFSVCNMFVFAHTRTDVHASVRVYEGRWQVIKLCTVQQCGLPCMEAIKRTVWPFMKSWSSRRSPSPRLASTPRSTHAALSSLPPILCEFLRGGGRHCYHEYATCAIEVQLNIQRSMLELCWKSMPLSTQCPLHASMLWLGFIFEATSYLIWIGNGHETRAVEKVCFVSCSPGSDVCLFHPHLLISPGPAMFFVPSSSAAQNPYAPRRYGSYDKSISVTRNVNLPDSLLSRFDMLFVVLDCMNESQDRMVRGIFQRENRLLASLVPVLVLVARFLASWLHGA
eukprot:scaffold153295_cov19-Tisochrysis_lutea.AAC.1